MITAVAVTVVLGVMVLVHEWGHFVVAKAFGVRVEVFSIGFGPRLFGRKRGDTDYRVSALPLGGYVKMAGDNPLEERAGAPDEFLSKPRWQRALVAIAGPAMNVITAVVLIAAIYIYGSRQPAYLDRPMVLAGVIQDSAAAKAGLQAGDRVVQVGDARNPTWDRARLELMTTLPGHTLPVVVDRSGKQRSLNVTVGPYMEDVFGYPADKVIVDSVSPGMPAERGGLRSGDQILAVDGKSVPNAAELPPVVEDSQGEVLDILVERGDRELHFDIRPERVKLPSGATHWQIGVMPTGEMTERHMSVGPAIEESVVLNALLGRQICYVVADLFTGRMSLKQLEGPLGIARESGRAAREGVAELLSLMAVIGMNLAILNLLPIPPLDGGHMLFLLIEGTMRRDMSVRVKERFVTVSMVFLLLVFAIVMYNDVLRLIPHH